MVTFNFLPIEYDSDANLLYFDGEQLHPDVRTLEQAKPVLYNSDVDAPRELYYMYRNVFLDSHKELFERFGIRYDITVLPPLFIGSEYNKTVGHFHPVVPGTDMTYTEIYEVLYGNAYYMLFNKDEVRVVEAKAGDQVIVPPNFGHITINPSEKKPLIMANLVSSNFASEYKEVRERKGGPYYYIKEKSWIKNPYYKKDIQLNIVRPNQLFNENIYSMFVRSPTSFNFLRDPSHLFMED